MRRQGSERACPQGLEGALTRRFQRGARNEAAMGLTLAAELRYSGLTFARGDLAGRLAATLNNSLNGPSRTLTVRWAGLLRPVSKARGRAGREHNEWAHP